MHRGQKAVQNAEEKTSGQIDGQSAEGKPFHDGIIQAAGKKVPENSADEASQADQEDAFHGGNITMPVSVYRPLMRSRNGK